MQQSGWQPKYRLHRLMKILPCLTVPRKPPAVVSLLTEPVVDFMEGVDSRLEKPALLGQRSYLTAFCDRLYNLGNP